MSIDWDGVYITGFFTGLCIVASLCCKKEFEEETKKFADFCKKNGFTFNETPKPISQNYNNNYFQLSTFNKIFFSSAYRNRGKTFDIFSLSDDCRYSFEMVKHQDGKVVRILDYGWHYGGSKSGYNEHYLLCQIKSKNFDFPDFFLRNRSFTEKYAVPKDNVDIEEDNSFSNLFVINSLDSENTKDFFSNVRVRDAFKKYYKKDIYYKANGKYFLVYKPISLSTALFDNGFFLKIRLDLMETGLDILKEIAS